MTGLRSDGSSIPRTTGHETTGPGDTGARLRAAYDSAGGVRGVFSAKVPEYAASRPGYPPALLAALREMGLLRPGAAVADVGAGTGLLTRELLRAGCRVTAVEPNPEMRREMDRLLGGEAGYRGVDGSAEAMPLETGSVGLVTAAQAFHWFELERARAEFLRVLTPSGRVALVWNDRVLDDPLHVALDDVFAEFGGARRGALVAHEERGTVPRFFGAGSMDERSWPNEQRLDEEGLLALVFSRSYMPPRDTPAGQEAARRVRETFRRLREGDGCVVVRYRTVAIIGRPGLTRHERPPGGGWR